MKMKENLSMILNENSENYAARLMIYKGHFIKDLGSNKKGRKFKPYIFTEFSSEVSLVKLEYNLV